MSKKHQVDVAKLLEKNPHLDAKRVRQIEDTTRQLKELTGEKFAAGYRIVSPFQSLPRIPAKTDKVTG